MDALGNVHVWYLSGPCAYCRCRPNHSSNTKWWCVVIPSDGVWYVSHCLVAYTPPTHLPYLSTRGSLSTYTPVLHRHPLHHCVQCLLGTHLVAFLPDNVLSDSVWLLLFTCFLTWQIVFSLCLPSTPLPHTENVDVLACVGCFFFLSAIRLLCRAIC